MKNLPGVFVILLFVLTDLLAAQSLVFGTEEIVPNQIYVVHSGMSRNNQLINTSNIYVIKGLTDSVWIFGTGYGDRSVLPVDTSDVLYYRGDRDATRNAIDDALQVDSIITNFFGIARTHARLMFFAPHFHLDHINDEFIAALLDSLHYPLSLSAIFIHQQDYQGAICNTPCCGDFPCNSNSQFFGAPFHQPWDPQYLNLFQVVGSTSDQCNDPVFQFQSPVGNWVVKKGRDRQDGGHTDGAVNLDNANLLFRILGAYAPNPCPVSSNWYIFPIHGNINIPPVAISERELPTKQFALHQNFPNPFNPSTTIVYELAKPSHVVLKIYNNLGQEVRVLVRQFQSPGRKSVSWDGRDETGLSVSGGVYFSRLTVFQSRQIVFTDTRKLVLAK